MAQVISHPNPAAEVRLALHGQLTIILVSAAIMVALWVYFGIWTWAIRFALQGRLLRPDRPPPVPWNGWQLLVLVFLIVLFWPLVVDQAMKSAGLLVERSRSSKAPVVVSSTDSTPTDEEKPAKSLPRLREDLLLNACLYPFWIGSILILLRLTSGAGPEDMGLTTRRWPRYALYGFIAWVLFAPPVFLFNGIINLIYRFVLRAKEEQHPLTRLLGLESNRADAVLIVLTAVIAAPFFEELLFRGVLLPWFAKRRYAGLTGLAGAFIFALLDRLSELVQGVRSRDWHEVAQGAGAPLFVLVMVPIYFLVCSIADLMLKQQPLRIRLRTVRWTGAIFASSLLFAAAHSSVWPSPISLFFLALVLGYLAYRTGNLISSMVLHGLFNGISCAFLLLMPQPEKGNAVTTAVPLTAPASNSSTVPGP
jgi:membrane protease YdiL (CAAX protease family)